MLIRHYVKSHYATNIPLVLTKVNAIENPGTECMNEESMHLDIPLCNLGFFLSASCEIRTPDPDVRSVVL